MKTLVRSLLPLLLLACSKPDILSPETVPADMAITQTLPLAGTVQRYSPIRVQVRVTGPNQCYVFAGFQVFQPTPLTFEVTAKATIPNPDRNPVCAPTTVNKDTVLQLPTQYAGKHAIRYYNGTTLYKIDSVDVVN